MNDHRVGLGRVVEFKEVAPLLDRLGDGAFTCRLEEVGGESVMIFREEWAAKAFAKAWAGA